MSTGRVKEAQKISTLSLLVTLFVLTITRTPQRQTNRGISSGIILPSWFHTNYQDYGVNNVVDIALFKLRKYSIKSSKEISNVMSMVKSEYPRECFGVTYRDSRLYTWAEYDWGNYTSFPYDLYNSRKYHVLSVISQVTQRNNNQISDFEAVFCLGDCVVSGDKEARAEFERSAYTLFPDPLPVFSLVYCSDFSGSEEQAKLSFQRLHHLRLSN